jgi:hypothetical protein
MQTLHTLRNTVLVGVAFVIAGVAGLATPAAAAATGAAEAASIAAAPPPPPRPGRCGPYYRIGIGGGEAMVRECRPNRTQIRVNGWVRDTRRDFKCAQVYAAYNVSRKRDFGKKACGIGTKKACKLPLRQGTNAFIYLRLI